MIDWMARWVMLWICFGKGGGGGCFFFSGLLEKGSFLKREWNLGNERTSGGRTHTTTMLC